jgi:hypothetical protein
MIAQMAATAGSVAIGSTIGHGISSMLFGSSGAAAETQAPAQNASASVSCDVQAKGIIFTCQISSHHLTHPVFPERLHALS